MTFKQFEVSLENFDGPLDLLLSLIRDKKMDVQSISLASVASSYLEVIKELKASDINVAAEYLVMATTLLQIKSKSLLKDDSYDDISPEEKDILNQLVEYHEFKKISKKLREKEEERRKIFIKKHESYDMFEPKEDLSFLSGKSSSINLIMTLRKMFERTYSQKLRQASIETFNLSPSERRWEIIELLKIKKPTFENLFSVPSLNHFAITMLTILDMARKQELIIYQNNQFGEIKIKKGVINE